MNPGWVSILPVYSLISAVMKSSFADPGFVPWFPLGLAVIETVGLWVLAARIFAYVDIAVALE